MNYFCEFFFIKGIRTGHELFSIELLKDYNIAAIEQVRSYGTAASREYAIAAVSKKHGNHLFILLEICFLKIYLMLKYIFYKCKFYAQIRNKENVNLKI